MNYSIVLVSGIGTVIQFIYVCVCVCVCALIARTYSYILSCKDLMSLWWKWIWWKERSFRQWSFLMPYFIGWVLFYIYIYSFFGEGNSSPLQYSCLEKNGQRSLAGYSPWGRRVEVTEWLSTHIPFHILLLILLQDIEYSSLCYLICLFLHLFA